jgi:hypothetical protein
MGRLLMSERNSGRLAGLVVLVAALVGCVLPQVASAGGAAGLGSALTEPSPTEPVVTQPSSTALGYSLTPTSTEPYAVCPPPAPGNAGCLSVLDPQPVKTTSGYKASSAGPLLEGGGEGGGLDPENLQSAYKIPATGGSTQTVAIVDAYDDPNAEKDLETFRAKYKLDYKSGETTCTKANGCFKKVNQTGEETNYPSDKYPHIELSAIVEDWGLEMSLDLDMVSSACPECKIILVEATNEELSNLDAAESEAVALESGGKKLATEVSNSWGSEEYAEETSSDTHFNHPDVPTTASAGDSGYGVEYPAASKDVISVGGTTLKKNAASERGWEETVWEGTGSGCSAYESKPAWQGDASCSKRTDNDVAADANNNKSPVSVYDSYEYKEESGYETGKLGWVLLGGTSVASPLVAGIEAHASSTVKDEGAEAFYRHALFGVTSGSNGICGHTYLCEAGEGYNGPAGWGTPDGPLELTPKTSAITEAATSLMGNEAKLNGYVYTAGLSTTYHFEYGPTTSYGTRVPVPNGKVGSGATWQAAGQSTNALHTLQGTYHYRLVSTNSSGTVYGADHTLTTIPWTAQATPNPTGSEGASLAGVSCSSSTACTAVSSYYSGTEQTGLALAEGWNGIEWAIQSTPKPAGAKSSGLTSVSCSSSTACTAVGNYVNSSGINVTLAERWNGTEWSIQATPNPTGATESDLGAVSCASSTTCTTTGYYKNSSGIRVTLAERWNGTEWAIQTTPNPAGATESFLAGGVSCTSSTACTATGFYVNSSEVDVILAEHWNGTEWAIQTTPNPTGATESRLNGGVSCTSSTICTTTGYYKNSSGIRVTLAERWNGTEWAIQTTPNPTGATESNLSEVSCASSTECIAVGGTNNKALLSERWNGVEWSIESTAAPEEAIGFEDATFSGVSCLPSKACTAVGKHIGYTNGVFGYNTPLAEHRATPKPYVETKEVASTTETGATLQGVVNPESSETKYYFEYGTTEAYGAKTAEASAGSGESDVEESKVVTGLMLGTTYDFRIDATSGGGTTDGPNQKFVLSVKPSVETKAPTSIGEAEATLNGIVNPKAAETKYYFEYGTTEAYGSKTTEVSAGSGITNLEEGKVITGLVAGSTYHFRIVATNSHGTTDGSDRVFSTRGKPSVETKPATSVGEKEATLSGMVNPRGTETKYYFEYGTTEAYGSKTAEASAGSGESNVEESKTITGLPGSTTYYFRIVGTNSHGTTDGANRVFSTTGKPTVETKPATSIYETGATLNGIVNPRGSETKYYFEYGTSESYGSKTTEVSAGSGITNLEESKVITGLVAGTTYHFRIVATNSHGTADGVGQMFTTTTTPSWRVTPTPNPTGEKQSRLEGTSCTSPTTCTAVGYYKNSSGARLALAEVWNGEEWKEQVTPKPFGSTESELYGVSCTSSSACTAVGSYLNSLGVAVPLAERWNGEAWSVQEPPSPTGAKESGLFGVSCASSSACTAVGAYINSAGAYTTLGEDWNGTSWSITETPNPTGAKQGQLVGVSCTSSSACTAVGEYENSEGTNWLAEAIRWNGEKWTLQEPSNPPGSHNMWPYSVSCTSASMCTLVGYDDTEGERTLAEGWNGETWSVQSTPNPSGSGASKLQSVSCVSATTCTAVGYGVLEKGGNDTLAESWNGTEWSIKTTPEPSGAVRSRLLGVSCASSTACGAVGDYSKTTSEEEVMAQAEIYG